MASNVTIPIYDQQTQTPYPPARPLNAPTLEPSPVGQALSEAGAGLMRIWNIQQENDNKIALADQVIKFARANTDIQIKTAAQPGNRMGQYYQDETDKLISSMLADSANRPIAQDLHIALKHAQAQSYEQIAIHGMAVADQDQAVKVNANGTQSAALAAAGYWIVPANAAAAITRNAQFAKPGSYNTLLPADQEAQFRDWVARNNIPFDPTASGPTDYDMRGYWKDVASKGGSQTDQPGR